MRLLKQELEANVSAAEAYYVKFETCFRKNVSVESKKIVDYYSKLLISNYTNPQSNTFSMSDFFSKLTVEEEYELFLTNTGYKPTDTGAMLQLQTIRNKMSRYRHYNTLVIRDKETVYSLYNELSTILRAAWVCLQEYKSSILSNNNVVHSMSSRICSVETKSKRAMKWLSFFQQ